MRKKEKSGCYKRVWAIDKEVGVGVRIVRVSERRGSSPALFLLITNYKLRITAPRVKVGVSVGGRIISRSRGRGKKNQRVGHKIFQT